MVVNTFCVKGRQRSIAKSKSVKFNMSIMDNHISTNIAKSTSYKTGNKDNYLAFHRSFEKGMYF